MTRKIVTDVRYTNWPLIFFIGMWAMFFPSAKSREYCCEHCGKTFPLDPPAMGKGGTLVGNILGGLAILFCGAIVYFVIQAFRNS